MGITTDGRTGLLLQNLRVDSSVQHVVDGALPRPAAGVVPLWAQGSAYQGGKRVAQQRGPLPLPTLADAAAQAIPLACASSSETPSRADDGGNGSTHRRTRTGRAGGSVGAGHLCGGSAADPSTGAPYRPRPLFDDPENGVLNALSAGAFGDGAHDDTEALQAAITASRTVFLPFGIYMISATLVLRPDSRIVGEGYSVLRMLPHSFGRNEALIRAPASANAGEGVALAGVSFWNADCGNDLGIMLAWEAGPASSMHDVNMLVATIVAAKAVVLGPGAGYTSNTWWPATMSYQPSVREHKSDRSERLNLRREGEAATRLMPARAAASAPPCAPSLTEIGVVIASQGPMWHIGVNIEHAATLELGLEAGATNHMFVGVQTEEAPVAMQINATKNVVVWGALLAFWNASQSSPAPVVATRVAARSTLDYRIYGLSIPVSASDEALLIDVGQYEIAAAAGAGFTMATAVLN